MHRFTQPVVLLVVLLVVTGGSPAAAQDSALEPVTFTLTYIPNIQFAPVYVAIARGYFADAGFEVTVEHVDEPVAVDLVAAGERDFALVSGEQVIAARAAERPVVFVYEWFDRYPVGIVATDRIPATSVAELAGEIVGIPGRFGASYSGLTALLGANGLTEADLDLEEIGFNAPDVLCVGGVEASVVYLNNEPLAIADRIAAGECAGASEVRSFPVYDAVQLVSNGVITSERLIDAEPERVAAFVAAFDRGLRDSIANPPQAYLISTGYVENLPLPDALRLALESAATETPDISAETLSAEAGVSLEDLLQYRVLLATVALWDGDPLGETAAAAWEASQEALLAVGMIDAPIDLSAAFTNAFVPPGA